MENEGKRKNKKVTILVVLGAIFGIAMLIFVGVAGVNAEVTPMLTWGYITINGEDAPLGTVVEVFVGNDSVPSGSTITNNIPGQYGAMVVQTDESRYGEPLHYYVNGVEANQAGPDEGIFSLENQIVILYVDIPIESIFATWTFPEFSYIGMYPRHLPEPFNGQVVLANLTDVPEEVQGVYHESGTFWAFEAPGCTLLTLEGGLIADYLITSVGACEWEIPLN